MIEVTVLERGAVRTLRVSPEELEALAAGLAARGASILRRRESAPARRRSAREYCRGRPFGGASGNSSLDHTPPSRHPATADAAGLGCGERGAFRPPRLCG